MTSSDSNVPERDLLTVAGSWEVEYRYTAGRVVSEFFHRLRDEGAIYGTVCSSCNTTFLPPRETCVKCYKTIDSWVKCGRDGTITAWTINFEPFPGSPEVPYAVAYVRLEGATTSLANHVKLPSGFDLATEPPLAIGMKVRTVFRDERDGSVRDFWFELDDSVSAPRVSGTER